MTEEKYATVFEMKVIAEIYIQGRVRKATIEGEPVEIFFFLFALGNFLSRIRIPRGGADD